eukprot:COSAG01_NODE_6024_length_3895_cov_4.417808_5_plen_135_part_00
MVDGAKLDHAFILRHRSWVGMNTLLIYLLAPSAEVFGNAQKWLYFNDDSEHGDIRSLIHDHIFCGDIHKHQSDWTSACPTCGPPPTRAFENYCGAGMFSGAPQRHAIVLWTLFRIAFWSGVAGYLHHRQWYWAL